MKFTYYIIPNYLNSKQISKINFLCKKAQSFNKSAETIKTSTAKQINFDEVSKIKNFKKTIYWINREVFGFDLYQNIDDNFIHNTYKKECQYEWHFDGEPYTKNYTSKLTVLINLSDKKYSGGEFYLFDGAKPLMIKEFEKAGSLIMFPSYFLHKVTPVTKGERKSGTIFMTGPWWR